VLEKFFIKSIVSKIHVFEQAMKILRSIQIKKFHHFTDLNATPVLTLFRQSV